MTLWVESQIQVYFISRGLSGDTWKLHFLPHFWTSSSTESEPYKFRKKQPTKHYIDLSCNCFYTFLPIQSLEEEMATTPVFLPDKSHGRRSLVGCSPWGCKESGMTERLHFHFSLSCIGEGHGNPLQCSCLENPRDWGAWWAAVYGVAQSRT